MQFPKLIFLIIILNLLKADEFDTLSYVQKFDIAVHNFKDGRFRLAESGFKSILKNEKNYNDPAAQLLLAKSQYRQGKLVEALRSGKSLYNTYMNSPFQIHVSTFLGDISMSRGNFTRAIQYYLSIRPQINDSLQGVELDKRILCCIGNGNKPDKIEGFLFRERDKINKSILNFSRAYTAWKEGDEFDLNSALEGINPKLLSDVFIEPYYRLIDETNQSIVSQTTFAVILPLSGFEKEKGESYLLGLAIYLSKHTGQSPIRFKIYDSRGDGITVLNAVKSIQSQRDIIGILGPILEKNILALGGFPSSIPILVPKFGTIGLPEFADHLFFLSPSVKTIAQRTAQIMVKEYGFENIAILSPGDSKSKRKTDFFIDELFQMGIDPVDVEWYIENPENISRQFKSIRKTAWSLVPEDTSDSQMLNLAIDSLDALFDVDVSDFFELPEEEEKMDKKDSAKVALETIHAIYIPIREGELTYVGTQFPMYNLKTVVFGNENWLDLDVLSQELIGPHVNGMKIVSDVSSAMISGRSDSFTNYHDLAIDHAAFIQNISGNGLIDRPTFIKKLRKHPGFNGENTSIKFFGKNQNENGSTQVIEYGRNKLNKIGVYDGQILTPLN